MVAHNNSGSTYTLGVTGLADLSPEEFKSIYLGGFKPAKGLDTWRANPDTDVPSAKDWRNTGTLTPVKNQGQCGSCWAFSTMECLESREQLAGNKLVVLSEQQLVDCDKVDHGCQGGLMQNAFGYLQTAGAVSEAD
jgi:C1A family cysteine protease